ncbi:SDR family NAD(P)-dependent oxidoreductase [Rhizobium nepotum]|uniref:SDR family NAD(P)-dependent oxidoreductase n=1 Tax=Rhizobium nepotum TaxID=1035271 RepID=UPI003369E89D
MEAAQTLAPLEIAVYNAGSNRPSPFLEQAKDEFETHWREHALGGFNLARASLPVLLSNANNGAAGRRASLIFTGASGSLRGKAGSAAFSAAKGAPRNLPQSLAREFGPQGVHVAHVVIDGDLNGERLLSKRPGLLESRAEDGLLNIDAIAETYWILHHQHRSAWTQELDLRPWSENIDPAVAGIIRC